MRTRKLNLKSSFFNLLGYVGGARHGQEHTPRRSNTCAWRCWKRWANRARPPTRRSRASCALPTMCQALWYARSELMAALAEQHGEARARQELERLGALFTACFRRA